MKDKSVKYGGELIGLLNGFNNKKTKKEPYIVESMHPEWDCHEKKNSFKSKKQKSPWKIIGKKKQLSDVKCSNIFPFPNNNNRYSCGDKSTCCDS